VKGRRGEAGQRRPRERARRADGIPVAVRDDVVYYLLNKPPSRHDGLRSRGSNDGRRPVPTEPRVPPSVARLRHRRARSPTTASLQLITHPLMASKTYCRGPGRHPCHGPRSREGVTRRRAAGSVRLVQDQATTPRRDCPPRGPQPIVRRMCEAGHPVRRPSGLRRPITTGVSRPGPARRWARGPPACRHRASNAPEQRFEARLISHRVRLRRCAARSRNENTTGDQRRPMSGQGALARNELEHEDPSASSSPLPTT
jgi:hypothetical protein